MIESKFSTPTGHPRWVSAEHEGCRDLAPERLVSRLDWSNRSRITLRHPFRRPFLRQHDRPCSNSVPRPRLQTYSRIIIINPLVRNWGWGNGLYSVNIPMIERVLHDDRLKIYWMSVWRSNYGRLFKEVPGLVDDGTLGRAEKIHLTNGGRECPSWGRWELAGRR